MLSFFADKILNTVIGQTYFRVSKHLQMPITEVIRRKFEVDISLLITYYAQEIYAEIEQNKKIKDDMGRV